MNILKIKKTKSTNDYVLKFVKKRTDTVVVSETQTKGRGTKGRSFFSQKGGLYLSYLKFYENLDVSDAFSIIRDVSVAVVKTLLAFGVKAKIKWPNDILCDGKKICGILTENSIERDKIVYSIIGIGLNVNNELQKELEEIATTMKNLVGKQNLDSVLSTLIMNLATSSTFEEYRSLSCVIGKKVAVFQGEKVFDAVVKDILKDGRIQLESGETLSSAEIKIKI